MRARHSLAWRGLFWRSLLSLALMLTGATGAGARPAGPGLPLRSAHACHGEHAMPETPAPSAPCCADHVCHCGCLPVAASALPVRLPGPEPDATRTTEVAAWSLTLRPSVLLRPPNPAAT